jgi:hypothetical protein
LSHAQRMRSASTAVAACKWRPSVFKILSPVSLKCLESSSSEGEFGLRVVSATTEFGGTNCAARARTWKRRAGKHKLSAVPCCSPMVGPAPHDCNHMR